MVVSKKDKEEVEGEGEERGGGNYYTAAVDLRNDHYYGENQSARVSSTTYAAPKLIPPADYWCFYLRY